MDDEWVILLRIFSIMLVALSLASHGHAQAKECLLNYVGARIPYAPEGPLVRLMRQENGEAADRSVRATNGRSSYAAYVPDETGILDALAAATYEGRLATVQVLIERKVFSVNEKTPNYFYSPWPWIPARGGGETALHVAARYGRQDIVKYLVLRGASLNIRSHNGNTPLTVARLQHDDSMARLLVELGAR